VLTLYAWAHYNRPHGNTMIGTLAVDGWAVTLLVQRGGATPQRAGVPHSPMLAVLNVTAHPSTASVLTS